MPAFCDWKQAVDRQGMNDPHELTRSTMREQFTGGAA